MGLLGGCGAEGAPFDELPLRDALRAEPEVIAGLPEDVRRELGERLIEEGALAGEEGTPAESVLPAVSSLVGSADEVREAEGKDAVVLGVLEAGPGGFSLRALAVAEDVEGALPPLVGRSSPSTQALEEAALRGRAGAILVGLAEQADADEIVRVTRWPVGAVVADRTIYVNASWLIALAALDGAARPGAPAFGGAPGLVPRSIDGNPYDLPGSVDQCVADVQEQCACIESDQCQRPPIDPTFTGAKAECAWVDEDPVNDEALCVLALLSIEQIADCVAEGEPPCTSLPVTNKESAQLFVQSELCMDYLDSCLATGSPSSPTAPPPSSSCSDDCDACDSPNCNTSNCNSANCGRCDDGCDNGGCNDGDRSAGGCDDDSCDNDNCKCEVARPRRAPPDGGPWGTAFWLIGPALYMAARTRRRA